jgi:hypothetical protein
MISGFLVIFLLQRQAEFKKTDRVSETAAIARVLASSAFSFSVQNSLVITNLGILEE